MKGLVISWILLYVANRIINAVMPAVQQSTQSGVTSYFNVGDLLGTAASVVLLVLEVKILFSKVSVEEPHFLPLFLHFCKEGCCYSSSPYFRM